MYLGKVRLFMQAFSCLYVPPFATLLSVTTGYRAQLLGYLYYGYDAEKPGQLQPFGEISQPSIVIYNGSRFGLSYSRIYAPHRSLFLGEFHEHFAIIIPDNRSHQ